MKPKPKIKTLEDIKGYNKLAKKHKIKYAIKLHNYLKKLDKITIENMTIEGVKNEKIKKRYKTKMIIYGKKTDIYFEYKKIETCKELLEG